MNKLKKYLAPEVIQGFFMFLCYMGGYTFIIITILFLNSIFGISECEVFTFNRIWEALEGAPYVLIVPAIVLYQLFRYFARINSKFNKIWNFSLLGKLSKYRIFWFSYLTIMIIMFVMMIIVLFYITYLFCTGNICK